MTMSTTRQAQDISMSRKSTGLKSQRVQLITLWFLLVLIFFDSCLLPSLVEAGEKGRDIIIYDGKVILKGGKKKGNIIISNGSHGQGKYKYKKKYMDYGGYWK